MPGLSHLFMSMQPVRDEDWSSYWGSLDCIFLLDTSYSLVAHSSLPHYMTGKQQVLRHSRQWNIVGTMYLLVKSLQYDCYTLKWGEIQQVQTIPTEMYHFVKTVTDTIQASHGRKLFPILSNHTHGSQPLPLRPNSALVPALEKAVGHLS